jgi:hypothetical protein
MSYKDHFKYLIPDTLQIIKIGVTDASSRKSDNFDQFLNSLNFYETQ